MEVLEHTSWGMWLLGCNLMRESELPKLQKMKHVLGYWDSMLGGSEVKDLIKGYLGIKKHSVVKKYGYRKILHVNVYSSFSHNHQKLKGTKISFIRERINTLRYINTLVYYFSIKRNELWSHEKTWRNLKCIPLSDRSLSEKAAYDLTLWPAGKDKTMETAKDQCFNGSMRGRDE